MRVVEIVFEERINRFGLSLDEVVEIVRKTIEEFNDGNGIKIELRDWNEDCNFEFAVKSKIIEVSTEIAEEKLKTVYNSIIEKLRFYSSIKPFLHLYSKNGNSREIFK